jgi:hypothetical protein
MTHSMYADRDHLRSKARRSSSSRMDGFNLIPVDTLTSDGGFDGVGIASHS